MPTDLTLNYTLNTCNFGSIQARTVDNGPENMFRHHLQQFYSTNGKF